MRRMIVLLVCVASCSSGGGEAEPEPTTTPTQAEVASTEEPTTAPPTTTPRTTTTTAPPPTLSRDAELAVRLCMDEAELLLPARMDSFRGPDVSGSDAAWDACQTAAVQVDVDLKGSDLALAISKMNVELSLMRLDVTRAAAEGAPFPDEITEDWLAFIVPWQDDVNGMLD